MDPVVDKANRLFQFLADLQSQNEHPVRKISSYSADGDWVTLKELGSQAQASQLDLQFESGMSNDLGLPEMAAPEDTASFMLRAARPRVATRPSVPRKLRDYVTTPVDNPRQRPAFDFNSKAMGAPSESHSALAEAWLESWDDWARSARAHELYQRLFEIQVKATQQADEYELVLGTGWLNWDLESDETVDRPIFALPLEIAMDNSNGAITVQPSGEPLRAELEALPASRIADGRFIEGLRKFLDDYEGRVTRLDEFSSLAQFAVTGLSTESWYEPQVERLLSDGRPVMSWSPTLILRPRRRVGLAETFRSIADGIQKTSAVPDGLRPLVDPGFEMRTAASDTPGAVAEVGGETFSPLPLNDKQKKVIDHVDRYAQTIVQGPPGTGKTHMAAALLSHLLAQGKRVLVTAETDRALYEIRDKMPTEVRELAVSVIGSNSKEMADLRTAIETIERRSSNFDEADSRAKIAQLEERLRALGEERSAVLEDWAKVLVSQQELLDVDGYRLPLPQALQQVQEDATRYGWVESIVPSGLLDPFPLDDEELITLDALLRDDDVEARGPYEGSAVFDPAVMASSSDLQRALFERDSAQEELNGLRLQEDSEHLKAWEALSPVERDEAVASLESISKAERSLQLIGEAWAGALHTDLALGDLPPWDNRYAEVTRRVERVTASMESLESVQRINVAGDIDVFVPQAQSLLSYLQGGKTLNVRPDGTVKPPMFGGSVVKAALPFIDGVRINGLPPTTPVQVEQYLAYVSVMWEMEPLSTLWPFADIDQSDPVTTIRSIQTDMQKLGEALEVSRAADEALGKLRKLGFDVGYADAVALAERVAQMDAIAEANQRLAQAEERLRTLPGRDALNRYSGPAQQWITSLERALERGDVDAYQAALQGGAAAHRLGLQRQNRDRLTARLADWAPRLAHELLAEEPGGVWTQRLYEADRARLWLAARRAVEAAQSAGAPDLQLVENIDKRIYETVTALATERAWQAAAGSSRIDGDTRATMKAYVQAVRRLGKGTGKYADQHRRDVRRHLDGARSAVPVWIMPLYKVVEQFDLTQDMFDVIIVDEASQAGISSVFLQYLAPKIVVIGDDRQVSPSGVGIELSLLNKTAQQYLYDFNKIDSWVDPKRSLFDDANMRYGGRIALEEHRRCVPEIIEFSNELVYRPSNIELQPVRQVGQDRLEPFRITRVPGTLEGGTQKVNRVEADALVDRLIEVVGDPEYDGKTIGVISLLSSSKQADYMQKKLLRSLPPEVWEQRDLKVGSPADFQGAERDVVFLSMVTPSPSGARLAALTKLEHEQRYNVAVSRAKDQVWLFHSIGTEELSNHDDVRYKLLNYAYRVAQRPPEVLESKLVQDDVQVDPFTSVFEQRVYNQLVERGYTVIPQYDAFGRAIDLVVQGASGKLAIECDGDQPLTSDDALTKLSEQRELQRLGWRFVRVVEADFYRDRDREVNRIVAELDAIGIQPGDSAVTAGSESATVELVDSSHQEEDYDEDWDYTWGEPEDDPEDEGTVPLLVELDPESEPSPARITEPEEYVEFSGFTTSVYSADPADIDEGLLRIVQAEGPIAEELLFQRYVKAGGDARVRDTAKTRLTTGAKRLVKRGDLLLDGGEEKIYRLPDQPTVRARTKGPRSVGQIPDSEWREHIRMTEAAGHFDDETELLRAASQRVGFKRFTENIQSTLERIHWHGL